MMAVEQQPHVGIPGGYQEKDWMMGDQESEAQYQNYNGYQEEEKLTLIDGYKNNDSNSTSKEDDEEIKSSEHGQGDNQLNEKEVRKKSDIPYPREHSPRGEDDQSEPKENNQPDEGQELNGSEKLEWDEESGEKASPPPRAPSRQSTEDSEEDDSELMNMSEDQRQAMLELKNMKLDLAYTAEEDPPEYDVAERVRQLNEELANEPSPDEDRERLIKFKDNLVDLYAPPPEDYEETEPDSPGHNEDKNADNESPNKENDYDGDDDWHNEEDNSDGPQSVNTNSNPNEVAQQKQEANIISEGNKESKPATIDDNVGQTENDEDKVLVERDGKFELLSAKELTAEERDMYFGDVSESEPLSTARSEGSSQDGGHQPAPPKDPRPATANGTTGRYRDGRRSAPPRRAQSALIPSYENPLDNFSYTSPYALSPRDKKELHRQQKAKEKREKQEKELKDLEEKEKEQEKNEAFLAWLKKKQEESEQRKKEEKERRKTNDDENASDKQDPETAYKDWLKLKKQQKKQEKNIEQYQKKEEEETSFVRPRSECDKAYKLWLKKKNSETRKQRQEDKERVRMKRLLAKRSRKTQALSASIRQSQSFQYVDYYGYRF